MKTPNLASTARTLKLFERYYYGKHTFIGGTVLFHQLCSDHIAKGSTILEIGPGPTNQTTWHLSTIGPVKGVDISNEVNENSDLVACHVYDGKTLPFESNSFDACVSNYVLEHIERPSNHFKEVARILKPGGVYCFRTPNLFHYVSLLSWTLPNCVHKRLANRVRGLGPEAHDPYPCFYRTNNRHRIKALIRGTRLNESRLMMVEKEPSYGRAHALLFFPMFAYERLVNSSDLFADLRANIFGVLTKR